MSVKQVHRILSGKYLVFLLFILLAFFARILAGVTSREYIPWIVLVIQVGISVLILHINHEYRIIEKRTFVPAILFLLTTASNTALYNNLQGNISALAILLCLSFILKNYHQSQSQVSSFNIALILTLVSVFCRQALILYVPLFWIGFQWFRSFNARTFFASILGITTVYLFLFAWYLYNSDWESFQEKFLQLKEIFTVNWIEVQWADWVAGAFIVFLLILSAVDIFMLGFSEKIRTTLFFKFLYLLFIVSSVLACFFHSVSGDIQIINSIFISFLVGYYFTMSNNKWVAYLFIFTILFFVVFYILSCNVALYIIYS